MNKKMKLIAVAGVLIALAGPACRESFAVTAQEKRAQGDAILKRMSDKLKSAQELTFSTTESMERTRRNSEKLKINFNRQIAVRRPDRLWFKATGDRDLEGFYDGQKVTLVSHKEKVFGEFPAAPTLDETADIITARYDIPLPIADLLAFDPKASLKDAQTTGGWNKRETVGGVECDVLAYQHPNVDFSIWIPASGDPLPEKLQINYKARRGQPKTTVQFRNWNLSPQLSDQTFTPKVPAGYEGIPVIQRAGAVIPQLEEQRKKGANQTPTQPNRN